MGCVLRELHVLAPPCSLHHLFLLLPAVGLQGAFPIAASPGVTDECGVPEAHFTQAALKLSLGSFSFRLFLGVGATPNGSWGQLLRALCLGIVSGSAQGTGWWQGLNGGWLRAGQVPFSEPVLGLSPFQGGLGLFTSKKDIEKQAFTVSEANGCWMRPQPQ